VKQAQERNIKENKEQRSERYGYQTGPEAMERLEADDFKKIQELEKNNGILRTTILETQAKLDICETKHGHAALRKKELREVQRKRDKLLREVAELRDELKDLDQPGIKKGRNRIKGEAGAFKQDNQGEYTEETKFNTKSEWGNDNEYEEDRKPMDIIHLDSD